MEYKIIISTQAVQDTSEAYAFYEDQKIELGDRFLDELTHFYKKSKHHPTYYSFISTEKTIRALSLKIFPHKIIYESMQAKCTYLLFTTSLKTLVIS